MKNIKMIAITLLIILISTFFSCTNLNSEKKESNKAGLDIEKVETRNSSVTYTLVDAANNFNLTITFNQDGTNSLTSSLKSKIETYLNSRFSSLNFSAVSRTDAIFGYDSNSFPKEEVGIFGFGLDSDSNEIPIAFVFTGDGDGTGGTLNLSGNGSGIKHSCSGNPCTCCDFIYEEYDIGWFGDKGSRIIGCSCKTTPAACFITDGRCDHTIESTN